MQHSSKGMRLKSKGNIMQLFDDIKQLYTLQKQCHNSNRKYTSQEDFVLQNGKYFTPQSLPHNFETFRRCKKGSFKNAYNLAICHHGFIVVVGYASSSISISVKHAWCVDKNNMVYEVTWDKPGYEYFGVCLDTQSILEMAVAITIK